MNCNPFETRPGKGKFPAQALSPPGRLIIGICCFFCVLAVPLPSEAGTAFIAFTVTTWCMASGLRIRTVWVLFIFSTVMFMPIFCLAPWMSNTADTGLKGKILDSLSIIIRATSGIFVWAGTLGSLKQWELHTAIAHLPLPRLVSIIIIQILQQGFNMIEETRRLIMSIKTRGAFRAGPMKWHVIFSFPIIWLVRVTHRAERVAAAMTMRRYDGSILHIGESPYNVTDWVAGISVLVILTSVSIIRIMGIR